MSVDYLIIYNFLMQFQEAEGKTSVREYINALSLK